MYLLSFPTSRFLSYLWNLGSVLGGLLLVQVLSGLLLTLYYSSDTLGAFDSVQYICREVNLGWLVRLIHFNNASFIFIVLYAHVIKGLVLSSYRLSTVWLTGFTLLLLMMGAAFTGYVLVWSQIRYWAAVVITSLIGSVPVWGESLLLWLWGGYSVGGPALKLFFTVHFLLPFILLVVSFFHLIALHKSGSSSFLGYLGGSMKISFFPFYAIKDLLDLLPLSAFLLFLLRFPYSLGDPEMFECANSIVSPLHIVPEWYFLAFYAILRSIPSKGLGALSMLCRLLVLLALPLVGGYYPPLSLWSRLLGCSLAVNFVFLSWVGQCPLESPYLAIGQCSLVLYFLLFLLVSLVSILGSWLYSTASTYYVQPN